MQKLQFPINLQFNIASFANDFVAHDANGRVVAYVKQKLFKLKESVTVFSNESQQEVLYTIKADRWIDFSAAYVLADSSGKEIGIIARKGWRSIWKAEYHVMDQNRNHQYVIREENPWTKVLDSLLGEIPIISFFTGYFFHPLYAVTDNSGQVIARLKKQASFFGRKFEITKEGTMDDDDDDRILLGLMMMILLERRRG